jgi:hypothetical protein
MGIDMMDECLSARSELQGMNMTKECMSTWSEVEGIDTTGIHMVEVEVEDMTEERPSKRRSKVEDMDMTSVTPRVSKPHDYANHMFMRL